MRGAVRLATLLAAIALIPSTSTAPVDPITALAPVEVWADGFGDLQGVAVDPEGAVYVADRSAGTVTRIGRDRARTLVASGLDQPTGLAFDTSGRLVIAEEGANRVTRVEDDGTRTTVIANVRGPRWLVARPDGTLYVSALDAARPDDESADSEVILRRTASGEIAVLHDGLVDLRGQRATGLAVDSHDAVFATTSERTIVKLRPDATRAGFATGLVDPRGLAFDPDGHLFLADGSAGRILKFHAPAAPLFGATPPYTNVSPLSVVVTTEPGAEVVVEGASSVSGTADSAGLVDLTVSLISNGVTRLEVWSTGRGGDGLASRSADATVVHDSVAPTLDWSAPVSGTAAGVSVAIRARAADAGSGVATLTVTVDGRALETTLSPSLPAASVTATATWDGREITDGVHTVTVTASDRAGNVTTLSHSVLVGATQPTPGQPASTLAISTSAPNATDPNALRLTLAPASASVLQGGSTSFGIDAGNGPPRTGAARLSVEGLPAGVRASFVPARLGVGQSAQMLVTAAPGVATGPASFTVKATRTAGRPRRSAARSRCWPATGPHWLAAW